MKEMLLRFKVRLAHLPLNHHLREDQLLINLSLQERALVRVQSVRCRAWLHAHLPSTQILALSALPSQRRLQGSPLGNQRQRDFSPEEPLFSGAGGTISNSLLLQDTACPLRRGGVLSDFPDNIWKKEKVRLPSQKTTLTLHSQSPRSTKGHTGSSGQLPPGCLCCCRHQ